MFKLIRIFTIFAIRIYVFILYLNIFLLREGNLGRYTVIITKKSKRKGNETLIVPFFFCVELANQSFFNSMINSFIFKCVISETWDYYYYFAD